MQMISREQLHTARLSLNLSVNALAKLADVSPHTVWNLEGGSDFRASPRNHHAASKLALP
jgi:transcriptional regulator with XRE-family HTH domain